MRFLIVLIVITAVVFATPQFEESSDKAIGKQTFVNVPGNFYDNCETFNRHWDIL